jgi:hypothetical protein
MNTRVLKPILAIILATTLAACNSQPPAATPAAGPDFAVAAEFMNAYAAYLRTSPSSPEAIDAWITGHPLLTENFKSARKQVLADALKNEPEIGLGFDPILDAQDFPDKGFSVVRTDTAGGYVTVAGIGSPDFEVVVKVALQNNRSLVDGAGVVNIPQDKRARRN